MLSPTAAPATQCSTVSHSPGRRVKVVDMITPPDCGTQMFRARYELSENVSSRNVLTSLLTTGSGIDFTWCRITSVSIIDLFISLWMKYECQVWSPKAAFSPQEAPIWVDLMKFMKPLCKSYIYIYKYGIKKWSSLGCYLNKKGNKWFIPQGTLEPEHL